MPYVCPKCEGKKIVLKKSLHSGKKEWVPCSCTFTDKAYRPKFAKWKDQ